MRKILLMIFLLVWGMSMIQAQEQIEVTGLVMDEQKEPLIGVNIAIKDQPGLGTITDITGHFKIKMTQYTYLVFSYVGFEKQEVLVKENNVVNVIMKENVFNVLEDVIVTGLGARKKITVTGAVTTVEVEDLKTPTSSISNALAGNVPGIMARQTSGQPGDNVSEFWIRGISTFGAGSGALVLVDGFERDLNEINVEDIETFTVLKDASATAIYGSRGANGVVLVTTKHGKEGKIKINAKVEGSYNTRTKTPKLVDGLTYATMMNEALISRNQEPAYSESQLHLIATGLDQDLYPNVNWMDMLLKKGSPTFRANLDISGGGGLVRYYISGSFVEEDGMYKVDKTMKDYDTNANYRRWNYRMNADINVTGSTLLSVGVSGSLDKQNLPGTGYNYIWKSLLEQNPVSIPPIYSNGYYSARGEGEKQNPWVLITQHGYSQVWKNRNQITLNLDQRLDFITKGLLFRSRFGYDTNNHNTNTHSRRPAAWLAERSRDSYGNLIMKKIVDEQTMTTEPHSYGKQKQTFESEIHYNRNFNGHNVTGILKYSADQTSDTSENPNRDYMQAIDRRHQGLAGQFAYGWKNRYFVDFNFGYNGSENFAKGHQYGFFPAYSMAWNIAEEPFFERRAKWMDMFKVRYSYGRVGNDYLTTRFPYHSSFKTSSAYSFEFGDWGLSAGNNSFSLYDGLTYENVSSPYVTWEIAKKSDLGTDFSLFKDRISGTFDYFHERRDGIYMTRNYLPYLIGLNSVTNKPGANTGSVTSEGFDGNLALRQDVGNVNLTVRGNMTYSKNKINSYDEPFTHYPYLLNEGFRVNQARGLIVEGLFKDYDEIRDSPVQTFGEVAPGDIKYRDVNGDGKIDSNDVVPIGATTKPNLIYGFGMTAKWRGFDVNAHFQGAGKSTFFIQGKGVRPFAENDWGNIFTDVVGNYWALGTNEDPNATYPRLTYGMNNNNYRNSTYWLRDGSYMRLKTLEIGYTLPMSFLNRFQIAKARVYLMGTNLFTISKFKLWDPELGSSNGQQYPLSRAYTVGLTINL